MKKIIALDNKKHRNLGWIKPDNYMFTSKDNSVALTTYELVKAMMTFPIAFIQSERSFSPIAILGIKKNHEVLLPSLTFVATANSILYCGAIPHFIDVEKH